MNHPRDYIKGKVPIHFACRFLFTWDSPSVGRVYSLEKMIK